MHTWIIQDSVLGCISSPGAERNNLTAVLRRLEDEVSEKGGKTEQEEKCTDGEKHCKLQTPFEYHENSNLMVEFPKKFVNKSNGEGDYAT